MDSNGGYDSGYESCPCFWGRAPGSLISMIGKYILEWRNLNVLDAGCGEGKNAIYLARHGATVDAVDISFLAISNARQLWDDQNLVAWKICDIREMSLEFDQYDVIILYGLLHCFASEREIVHTVKKLQNATKTGGYHIVCAFNNRYQDLSAHPGFSPILIEHDFYLDLYKEWAVLYNTDQDLEERHPNNNIIHVHSMTRLIGQKGS